MQVDEKTLLVTNLAFVYRLIVASEELLRRAMDKCRGEVELYTYLQGHLVEEQGHAELLAADLANLGCTNIPHFHLAELMAGSQYYLIEHEHPAALLGYMAALECTPMPLSTVDEMEAKYGPLKCVRLHAEKDPQHGQDILQQIAKLPPEQRGLVQINYQRVLGQLAAAPGVLYAAIGGDQVRH